MANKLIEKLNDLANKINEKVGSNESMTIDEMVLKIEEIKTEPETEEKEVTPTEETQEVTPTEGKYLKKVTVNAIETETKEITPSEETQEVLASEGKYIKQVNVNAIPSDYVASGIERQEEITFIPQVAEQRITANKYLTGDVIIKGEPNLIAENIKKGVILYEGTGAAIVGNLSTANNEDMLQQLVNAKGNCEYLFYNYSVANLDFISNLDTSNATSMLKMFYGCTALTTIPLLDTSNVTSMKDMFYNCKKLTEVPLLDTSKVNTMESMFYNCTALTTIPLFNTSNLLSMRSMFYNCTALTTIPLLDTSKFDGEFGFIQTFDGCTALTTIPLFNTSKVTSFSMTFKSCTSLTTIPALDVSNITNFGNTFLNCTSLKSILMYGMKTSFDISASTQFEESDLVTILNNLATVTTTQTLKMGSTNLDKLTDADKSIATNKGWTLA